MFENFLEELGLAEALISVLDESSQGNGDVIGEVESSLLRCPYSLFILHFCFDVRAALILIDVCLVREFGL